jgi:peptidoglycan/LPS O-acetylase OafA/YrhL
MTPYNPIFAIIIFIIAYYSAYLIQRRFKLTTPEGRFEGIDGLRGFLALGVFIHHSTLWFHFLHENKWESLSSNFFNQLGQSTVALFFMITSFLFISKLINSEKKGYDWKAYFISRFFRLTPMYLLAVMIIIISVMFITHWKLSTGGIALLDTIGKWVSFTIFGMPYINNEALTPFVIAGVVWSLPYEWLFYFCLPIISLFLVRKKPSLLTLICSIGFIIAFTYFHGYYIYHLLCFIGGGIAPFLLKYTKISSIIEKPLFNIASIISLLSIGLFNKADNWICILIITLLFTLIATGNTIFGLLKNNTLKFLGEICYTTYLFHGIILFSFFYFVFGFDYIRSLTPVQYCTTIFWITPIVVIISILGFRFIEKPFMELAKRLSIKANNGN